MDPKLKQLIQFINSEKEKVWPINKSNTGNKAFDNQDNLINAGRLAMCQDILEEAERLIFENKKQ